MKKSMWRRLWAGLLLAVIMTAGCGSSGNSKSQTTESAAMDTAVMEEAAESAEYEMDAGYGAEISSENGIDAVADTGRKLIKNVDLEVQTLEFDEAVEKLTAKVNELGGYVEASSLYGSDYYYETSRSASYTVRIPADRLDAFVSIVNEVGNVTYKNERVDDVTLEYVDTESHKKALETEQERLLELLENAESMEDIITIESRLSAVRYELESYESQLRMLDNQVAYSTVYISLSEVERITETGERTFFQEVANRFGDSVYVVAKGLRGFAVGFLGSLPILAVWAVIIAVIVLIIRKLIKWDDRRRANHLQKLMEKKEKEKKTDKPE